MTHDDEVQFSNAMRLSGPQWLCVAVFTLPLVFAPSVWKHFEPLEPALDRRVPHTLQLVKDHRVPHELSNDYWFFERYTDFASSQYDTFLIGDSVIWGEYVTGQDTLSHYCNRHSRAFPKAQWEKFANLGLDGAHPLALEGLLRHYAGSIRNKNVVLHCNPLWFTSPRRDLQDEKATDFNHPRLVPQFFPRIPSYQDEISPRIGVLVERQLALSGWTTHLQQAYFDQRDIPSWTLEHPYDNPLKQFWKGLPGPDEAPRHEAKRWDMNNITKQDYPWIDLQTSLQWQAFQRVVELLQERDNQVFVLVGPFNEHLLNPKSLQRYQEVQSGIKAWLEERQIPHWIPPPLPSVLYGDASHPLAYGYYTLSWALLEEMAFWGKK